MDGKRYTQDEFYKIDVNKVFLFTKMYLHQFS